jgi:hypothetical protein
MSGGWHSVKVRYEKGFTRGSVRLRSDLDILIVLGESVIIYAA